MKDIEKFERIAKVLLFFAAFYALSIFLVVLWVVFYGGGF
jgi:hypothetical protein